MNHPVELASVVGSVALAGIGLAPFLRRATPPDTWFELRWSRDLDERDVESLLRHLAAVRRPEIIVFELRARRGDVQQFVGVTKIDSERIQHAFATFLPSVLLSPVNGHRSVRHALELRLKSREHALTTDAAAEVARSVIGSADGASGTVVVQWLLGPRLAPLHVPSDSVGLPSTGRAVGQAFRYGLAPLDARSRSALQNKVGTHGFRARLLIGSTIGEKAVALGAIRRVVGGMRVAEAPGNVFTTRSARAASIDLHVVPRHFGVAINVAELTGLLGWPLGDADYPGVVRVGSRRLPIPNAVAASGRIIGDGNHPRTLRPLALATRDTLLHTHAIGPTGTGKSTLLANLVIQDIEAGRGVVVVEPKGDLVSDILLRIPKHREPDVVVLDATDGLAPVGLNPLTGGTPELVADHLIAVLRGLYGDTMLGPRTTDVLHASLLTLVRSKRATLVALPLLLTDARLRAELTADLRGDLALGPFWRWYEGLSEAERQTVIAPSLNKVRRFLHQPIRNVVGQLSPRFHVSQVFTERKVLLVPLPKGVLGPETAGLVGSMVVAQVWHAAQARAQIAPDRRHPVSVTIDEFQDFLHLPTDLGDVLAQARGLGVGITLAHQHLAQLSPDLRAGVMANARNRVCFRLSSDDAAVMARTADKLDGKDFQALGRYEIYASLVAEGEGQTFASAATRPLMQATNDADRIRRMSRERYGRPVAEVDAELSTLVSSVADSVVGKRQRGRT